MLGSGLARVAYPSLLFLFFYFVAAGRQRVGPLLPVWGYSARCSGADRPFRAGCPIPSKQPAYFFWMTTGSASLSPIRPT